MTDASEFSIPPVPSKKEPVRVLLERLGIDVSDWAWTNDGVPIENPNDNISRNTYWSFIGKASEPTVLCVWYEDIGWGSNPPTYHGNMRDALNSLTRLSTPAVGKDGFGRLKAKSRMADNFQKAVWDAWKRSHPIKFILVDGNQVSIERAAEASSEVKTRGIDHASWYVHDYNGVTGAFALVRGVPRAVVIDDPLDGIVDPAEDPAFQDLLGSLSQTECDALIKARVGQGQFRDALIARWKGCAVTGCGFLNAVVASHIKPWSQCNSRDERLGVSNGLLLIPNLDRLFDQGIISFDERFKIILGSELKAGVASQLNVNVNMKIVRSNHSDILPFLQWHRENRFRP